MAKHYKSFAVLDPLPAHFPNALQEFLSSLGLGGVQLRIKPGASNTLQVPAGAGDAQAGLTVGGRWRYVTANVEIAGAGAARAVDVYATTHNNSYTSGSITVGGTTYPEEIDGTDYSFALAVVDAGAAAPGGVDASRKIGLAFWDGTKFLAVAPVVGGVVPVTGPPLVTSLPVGPYDGQEITYQADATNGVLWRLRYNAGSASAYKWEHVGGGDLADHVDATETTSTGAFADLTTVGPSVTVPLAGEYIVRFGARIGPQTSSQAFMAPALGATAASTANAIRAATQSGGTAYALSYWRELPPTALAASDLVRLKYQSNSPGASASYDSRVLFVRPRRVG